MSNLFLDKIEDCPVIAAVKDDAGLQRCMKTDVGIVFVLHGDLCSIVDIVDRLKKSGKMVFVHLDLITGLSAKEVSVDYIHSMTKADGIITTKQNLIKRAKELDMYTIQRFFVLDSLAIENILKQTENSHPDMIEVLPGVMPKVIKKICSMIRMPVIAGGLIADKEDIMSALSAGAVSISTTKSELWNV